MARTAIMRLLELMVLKEDISKVIEYIGKAKCFQFDTEFNDCNTSISNQQKDVFDKLQLVRNFLDIEDVEDYVGCREELDLKWNFSNTGRKELTVDNRVFLGFEDNEIEDSVAEKKKEASDA